ncbi:MAG: di-trans,poly-cis-decaprenylcistransferase [Clostridia bacterium]|nr:di-trans,poly-cis-decaprenylcistransferase [Clostridia bacterium]
MQNNNLPAHVGLIMDGNGRWAKKRLMPRSVGHKHGMNRMIGLAEHAKDKGIKYLTVYTLSTENLSRPQEELDGLFGLFRKYFTENVKKLYSKNSAVKVIGDISVLPEDIIRLLEDGEKNSPEGARFTLIFAINYGGRAEILNAVNRAVERGEKLDEKGLASLMYTDGIPDPDLIIRTGGELRLSNFLTYQSAYSELYFTDVYFPDFSDAEFDKALENFAARDRRFGKVK